MSRSGEGDTDGGWEWEESTICACFLHILFDSTETPVYHVYNHR
jgi:hypothetical protein